MITQLWGLSKRTLSKKGNLAALLHMEPSKFLAEFRSSAKKGLWKNIAYKKEGPRVHKKPQGPLFVLELTCDEKSN